MKHPSRAPNYGIENAELRLREGTMLALDDGGVVAEDRVTLRLEAGDLDKLGVEGVARAVRDDVLGVGTTGKENRTSDSELLC